MLLVGRGLTEEAPAGTELVPVVVRYNKRVVPIGAYWQGEKVRVDSTAIKFIQRGEGGILVEKISVQK